MTASAYGALDYAILAIVGASIAFLRWLFRREARRRSAWSARRCIACGYDLRSSPDVCPECGMPAVHTLSPEPLNLARLKTDWPSAPMATPPPRRDSPMSLALTAASAQQANLLANQLKARGVWAETRPGPDCTLVLVPGADADRAAAIVNRFRLRGTPS